MDDFKIFAKQIKKTKIERRDGGKELLNTKIEIKWKKVESY